MALRSLGSSLLAKGTPGSASRDLLEQQITKPALPGKGEIGTISRDLTSEPGITSAAPGSEKIITAGPGVEGSQVVQPTTPPNLLADGGFGLPLRSENQGGMPFTDSFAPAASLPAAGRVATARSGGGQTGPVRATGDVSVPGASTSVQAVRPAATQSINPLTGGLLGIKAQAADPGAVVGPTLDVERGLFGTSSSVNPQTGQVMGADRTAGQLAAGAAGKALTSVGTALGAPQLSPGGLGAKLQTFGGSATSAAQGKGSISNVLRSIANTVSGQVKNSPIVSILRSLFKR